MQFHELLYLYMLEKVSSPFQYSTWILFSTPPCLRGSSSVHEFYKVQAGLARWTRLPGKFSARSAGIPVSRYRDFANCEAWDEFTKPRKNGLNKMAKEKHSKQYKFDYVISAGALENVGFFFTAGPRHRGKSSFLRKRMWWPINFSVVWIE